MTRDAEHTTSPQSVVVPVDPEMPLPCPFCGCKVAEAGFWFAKTDTPPMAYVFCLECSDTEATDGPKRETLEEAITAWNRRAAPAPSSLAGGEVERAARLIDPKAWEFADKFSTGPHAEMMRAEVKCETAASLRIAGEVLAALSPEAPAREIEDDGTIYLMLQGMRSWALEMIRKHGDPNGTDYEQGQNDMGHRWVSSIDERLARLDALTPRHEAPADHHERNLTASNAELIEQALSHPPLEAPAEGAGEFIGEGDTGKAAIIYGPLSKDYLISLLADRDLEIRALRSSAPEAREGEAWPEKWSGPCTVGNMISNLQTLPPEMPLYSAYHIRMDDGPSLLKVKRPTLSRERVEGSNIKTGDKSVPYSAVIWSQPRDPEEAHPAAPSADKLRETRQDVINQMADNIEKLALTPAKRELVKAAFRACIGRLSTPDALKGDAK